MGAGLWWARAHECPGEKRCLQAEQHTQHHSRSTSCLLCHYGHSTESKSGGNDTELGQTLWEQTVFLAWGITTRNEVTIPTRPTCNKQILTLSVSSSFPRLCISMCLCVSKHKVKSNSKPTIFINKLPPPSYRGAAKSNFYIDINNQCLKRSEQWLWRLSTEQHWQLAQIDHYNMDVLQ